MLRANGVQFDSPRSKKKLSKALKMRDKFDGIDKNFEMYQINSENNNIDYEANEKKAMEPIKVETIENPQDLGFCSKFLLCFAVGSNTRTILSTERVSDVCTRLELSDELIDIQFIFRIHSLVFMASVCIPCCGRSWFTHICNYSLLVITRRAVQLQKGHLAIKLLAMLPFRWIRSFSLVDYWLPFYSYVQ